jgi:ubiquitin-conjugating enzyme E2 S
MLSSTQPSSSSNVENLHPQTVRQVLREMTELSQNPPEGIKVLLNEEDITDIQASIEGPGRVDTI